MRKDDVNEEEELDDDQIEEDGDSDMSYRKSKFENDEEYQERMEGLESFSESFD